MRELAEAARGLPLVVVGDGPLRSLFPQAVGFVPPSELGRYYERAAVVVVPSRREGYGMVAREAMAYGRPVVATAVGGLRDAVEDGVTGLLVPPRRPGALREAMRAPPRRRRAPRRGSAAAARAYAQANLALGAGRASARRRVRERGLTARGTNADDAQTVLSGAARLRSAPSMARAQQMRVLVTGGAGFVGGERLRLARARASGVGGRRLRQPPPRGSELNVPRLREAGVRFVHGDVRERDDLLGLGAVRRADRGVRRAVGARGPVGRRRLPRPDEPPRRVQLPRAVPARRRAPRLPLDEPRVSRGGASSARLSRRPTTRFELDDEQPFPGVVAARHRRDFPLDGARTLYGATKLAAELLIAEYATRSRCARRSTGAASSPARGRWARSTRACSPTGCSRTGFGRPLAYLGFGGSGKQVRDVLHVDDLVDLLVEQLAEPERWRGAVFNVGGGATARSRCASSRSSAARSPGSDRRVAADPSGRPGDVPIYVSDCSASSPIPNGGRVDSPPPSSRTSRRGRRQESELRAALD